jgi:DNA-binding Xre family transcriptional regulator
LTAVFFRTETGREPVREWLQDLAKPERKIIGVDIMTVQFRWPLGMPLVRNIGPASTKSGARYLRKLLERYFSCTKAKSSFCTASSRKPERLQTQTELWLCNAKMSISKAAKRKNKHRGSSFESFLKKERLHEEVHAAALKRAVALKVHDLMRRQRMNKSAMAARMRTSRAAIHRLLDPENTSVTLATLNRAARSLGRRVKIELVPA